MAAMLLQLQEVISLAEEQSRMVGMYLEEVNGHFNCHRGEINWVRIITTWT